MCAQSGACGPDFREAKTPRTLNRKTRLGRRVCIPAEAGKISATGIERFPEFAEIRKPLWRAPMKCAQNQPLPGGLRCNPGGPFALNFHRSARFLAYSRALAGMARQCRRLRAIRRDVPQGSRPAPAQGAALG